MDESLIINVKLLLYYYLLILISFGLIIGKFKLLPMQYEWMRTTNKSFSS